HILYECPHKLIPAARHISRIVYNGIRTPYDKWRDVQARPWPSDRDVTRTRLRSWNTRGS
ncbi:hypothetical protein EDB85DRAFT_2294127, partial [Lactarius pseudohatsudake]